MLIPTVIYRCGASRMSDKGFYPHEQSLDLEHENMYAEAETGHQRHIEQPGSKQRR